MATALLDFIKTKNRRFWDLLKEIDPNDSLFMSKKLKMGFTFLLPHSDYVESLWEDLEDDEDAIIDKLGCLIIVDYLPSPSDWNIHRDDIPNLHKKKLRINSIEGNKITMVNGAVIKRCSEFESNSIALFNVLRGTIEKGKDKSTRGKNTVKKPVSSNVVNVRAELYKNVINGNIYNNTLSYVASFLYFLRKTNTELLKAIVPYLDYCPITTFIILFEPNKGDRYFIDTDVLAQWYGTHVKHNNSKSIMQKTLADFKDSCGMYGNSKNTLSALNEVREDLIDQRIPKNLISSLNEAYNNLVSYNTIGAETNVLPESTFKYMKSRCSEEYNLKLVQDEIRAMVSTYNEEDDAQTALKETCRVLKLLPRLNDVRTLQSQPKSAFISTVACFVNTTYFLYTTPSKVGSMGGIKNYYTSTDPTSDQYVDPSIYKMEKLSGVKNKSTNYNELISQINSLVENGESVPRELREAVNTLLKQEDE